MRLAVSAKFVGLVTQQREPARLRHHEIEDVTVNDQIAAAIETFVDRVFHDLDAAEVRAVVAAQKFIVIAGNVDQPRTLARLPQQFLHDVVVRLRPIPGRTKRPAVDNIADEIDCFCVVMAEEVEQPVGLAAARSQVDVGDEQRAKPSRGVVRHDTTLSDAMIMRGM